MPRVTASVDWATGKGPDSLVRKLNKLERIFLTDELPDAMDDIGRKIEREAKERVPVDDGPLRASIRYVVQAIADGYTTIVGTNQEYAADVEFGTAPHTITANGSGYLRFTVDGEVIFRKSVDHPGTPAQPYLGPALDASRRYITDRLREAFANAKRRAS